MGATLPVFTAAGSIVRPTSGRNVFDKPNEQSRASTALPWRENDGESQRICKRQIASCVFCCTKSILQRKTACPQGDEAPPKSALFNRRFRRERIAIFSNRRGDGLTLKLRSWRKPARPAKVEGDAPQKRILHLSSVGKLRQRRTAHVRG